MDTLVLWVRSVMGPKFVVPAAITVLALLEHNGGGGSDLAPEPKPSMAISIHFSRELKHMD